MIALVGALGMETLLYCVAFRPEANHSPMPIALKIFLEFSHRSLWLRRSAGRVCIRGCKAARDEVCDVDAAGGAGAGSHRRDPGRVSSVARAASNGLSEMRIHGTTELRILPAMQHGAEPAVPVVRAKSGSRVVGMRVLWDAGGGACGWGEELNIRNRTKQKQTADPSPLKRVRDDIVC